MTQNILKARLTKEEVPAAYKRIAKTYDFWAKLSETKARKISLQHAAIQDGESILEVAVGTGLTFVEVLKLNPTGKNEGIDLTLEMLEQAKLKLKTLGGANYNLKVGDAYKLEFPDNSFDVLLNNYMFDLLPEEDFVKVLSEFKRVLKPGGRIVLTNMAKGIHWYQSMWELIYLINPALFGGCRGVSLFRSFEEAGFVDIKKEFISQLAFPSEVISASKNPL